MQAPETSEPLVSAADKKAHELARVHVSTSGKTETPATPRFSKEDLEYFRTHLLSEKPIVRFESHGTVAHVLADIDRHVPMLFGTEGEKAINTLHKVIRHYSVNEAWTYVVASLSTGIARHEVDALLARPLGHSGPLIIDPDASTEDHQLFNSETEARIQKERIIQANEANGKILLVLYAIDNPDGNKERDIAARELLVIQNLLDILLQEDAKFRSLFSLEALNGEIKERLERIGLKAGEKHDPHAYGLHIMHAVFMEMRGMESTAALPIYMAIQRFGIIPSRWANMGIVDADAEFAAELEAEAGRRAQEYRARLARGWKPPEERLREEAARADQERNKQAVQTDEARRHATVETQRQQVRQGSQTQERRAEVPSEQNRRDTREHNRPREADNRTEQARLLEGNAYRIAALQSWHEAEEKRLTHLMDNAHTPEERSVIASEIAAARNNFISRVGAARVQDSSKADNPAAEGTAEGAYAALTSSATISEQRFSLQQAHRGVELPASVEARAEFLQRERPAVDRFPETRSAVQAVETAQTTSGAPRAQEVQAERRTPEARNERAAPESQAERRAPDTQAEGKGPEAQAERTAPQTAQQPPPVSRSGGNAAEANTDNNQPPAQQGAEQPQNHDYPAAPPSRAQTEKPGGGAGYETLPQSEQASVLESEASKDAPGTQTPDARAALLSRTQPDESTNPQLTTENRAVEESRRPAQEGELDTRLPKNAERLKQEAVREEQKQEDIRQQVASQQETPPPSINDQRAEALAAAELLHQETLRRETSFFDETEERMEREHKAQKDSGKHIEDSAEEIGKQSNELRDMIDAPVREREEGEQKRQEEMGAIAAVALDVEKELRPTQQEPITEAMAEKRNDQLGLNMEKALELPLESTPDDQVVNLADVEVIDAARNNQIAGKDPKPAQSKAEENLVAEAKLESPTPKA